MRLASCVLRGKVKTFLGHNRFCHGVQYSKLLFVANLHILRGDANFKSMLLGRPRRQHDEKVSKVMELRVLPLI